MTIEAFKATNLVIKGIKDQVFTFIGSDQSDIIKIVDLFNGEEDILLYGLFGLPDTLQVTLNSGNSKFLLFNYTSSISIVQKEGKSRTIRTFDIENKIYNLDSKKHPNCSEEGNMIHVRDSYDSLYHLFVNTENIPNMEIIFSTKITTDLSITHTGMKISYFLKFPDEYFPNPQKILFCRTAYQSDIAIKGVFVGTIEPNNKECSNKDLSFTSGLGTVKSSIVVLPTNGRDKVNISIKHHNHQFGQAFLLDENSVRPTDFNENPIHNCFQNKIPNQNPAEILFAPNSVNMNLVTRDAGDFIATRKCSLIQLNLQIGNGRNFIELNSTNTMVNLKSGVHLSKLKLVAPLEYFNGTLVGGYGERNEVKFYARGVSPNLEYDGNWRIMKPISRFSNKSVGYIWTDLEDDFRIIYEDEN
eukprot:gene6884-11046_t